MEEHEHARGNHLEDPHSFEESRRALWVAIGVTLAVMVIEVIGGILSNSLALLSDAGHMLTDVMSLMLSLVALQLALRPPSPTRTYGLYRMEILAALINGTTLILISAYIIYQAYRRFQTPQVVDSHTMLWVAIVGLVANGIAAWVMMRSSKESLNLQGGLPPYPGRCSLIPGRRWGRAGHQFYGLVFDRPDSQRGSLPGDPARGFRFGEGLDEHPAGGRSEKRGPGRGSKNAKDHPGSEGPASRTSMDHLLRDSCPERACRGGGYPGESNRVDPPGDQRGPDAQVSDFP